MFIRVENNGTTFSPGHGNLDDFLGQSSVFLRCGCFRLAPEGKPVLVFPADAKIARHIFSGLGHGIDSVLFLHQRVDETPADGGIIHLCRAGKACFRLTYDKRGAGHTLDSACDDQVRLTGLYGLGRNPDSIHAGCA